VTHDVTPSRAISLIFLKCRFDLHFCKFHVERILRKSTRLIFSETCRHIFATYVRIVRETKCTSGVFSLLMLDCLSKNQIANNSREGTLRGYKTSNCAPRLANSVLWPRNITQQQHCRLVAGLGVFVFLRRCSAILKLTKSLELHPR